MQPSAVTVEKIKHKHSRKKSNFPLPSLTSALPPCSRPLEFIQPLATRAEAWQAIPGVSDWVMGKIKRGYSLQFARRPPRSLGLKCPIGVRAHSTRGIASSWAWSSGVSITEICAAAGWATPSTFAIFYNLDIPALHARVLSV